ncbi:Ig-like domain-containing protein [Streptomyces sp. NPDC056242]|uniref:Ig-like domain-containing protein n=1 Tax=Streptomyces sp. NPDC056242 TaxID=3345760 RepID=UPI0035D9B446
MPAQAEAVFGDGTTKSVDVTWDPVSQDKVAEEGLVHRGQHGRRHIGQGASGRHRDRQVAGPAAQLPGPE